MKRSMLILMVAAGIALNAAAERATANPPGTAMPSAPAAPSGGYRPPTIPIPPIVVRPRPPVYVPPPVVRVAPPPVVVAVPPAAPTSGFDPKLLTKRAWVGQNPTTRVFSIAFDAPGVSGPGILINAGYSNIVRGPTDWIDATTFLKSIGAPGW